VRCIFYSSEPGLGAGRLASDPLAETPILSCRYLNQKALAGREAGEARRANRVAMAERVGRCQDV